MPRPTPKVVALAVAPTHSSPSSACRRMQIPRSAPPRPTPGRPLIGIADIETVFGEGARIVLGGAGIAAEGAFQTLRRAEDESRSRWLTLQVRLPTLTPDGGRVARRPRLPFPRADRPAAAQGARWGVTLRGSACTPLKPTSTLTPHMSTGVSVSATGTPDTKSRKAGLAGALAAASTRSADWQNPAASFDAPQPRPWTPYWS